MNHLAIATSAREIFYDDIRRIEKLKTVEGAITRLLIAQPTGAEIYTAQDELRLKVGLVVEAPEEINTGEAVFGRHLRLVRDTEAEGVSIPEPLADLIPFPRSPLEK